MKKLLSVILTIVMLAQTATFAVPSAVDVVDNSFEETVPAEFSRTAELFAYTGTCGKNLTWTLDDEGTLTIDGTGDMYDYAVKWIDVELSDGSRCLVDADKTYMEFIHHDGSYSLLEPTKTYEEVTLSDGSTCLIESGRTYEEIELSDGSVHMVPSGGTYVEVILSDGSYAVKEVVPWSGYEVKKIVISENVTDISAGIFSNVPFEVDEENTAFTSDEHGVLYNKSKTILYSVPLDVVSYEMPDSVTEIGNYAFSYCENLEEIMLSNALQIIGKSAFEWCISLKSIIIPDSVTTIGECAFSSCCSLASVTGGNGLTTIGVEAFSYCEGLTSVVIPDSVITIGDRAFYECTELTSATIGNGVTTIGEEAFSCCYSLANVTIGDSVESIGDGAFCCCILLTNITVQNRDAAFGYYVFDNCDKVTIYGYEGSTAETYAEENDIPFDVLEEDIDSGECGEKLTWELNDEGVLTISGEGDMYNWEEKENLPWYSVLESIKTVVVEDGVTNIGENAFRGCKYLESIDIGEGVTSIGKSAFAFCTSLGNIEIPDNVTVIGNGAFASCGKLEYIEISAYVTSIGEDVFVTCSKLKGIMVDENNNCYSSDEVGVLYNKDKTVLICYPDGITSKTYTILNSVTEIGEKAFTGNENIISIVVPDSVTKIGPFAFYGCEKLESFVIPDRVTSIESYTFKNCANLASVRIPTNVTSIGNNVFDGCDELAICGYYGSFAETYAAENSIPFVALDETAEPKAFYTISEVTARAGDVIDITVSLKTEETFKGVGVASISYDEKVLTLDKVTIAEDIKNVTMAQNFDKSTMTFVAAAAEGVEGFDGKLFTLTFIINEEVLADEYGITGEANTTYGNEIIKSFVHAGKVVVTDQVLGDINLDDYVNSDDAILLLQNVLFPKLYPISYKGSVDFNKDGSVNTDDAIRLLQHAMFPSLYPID